MAQTNNYIQKYLNGVNDTVAPIFEDAAGKVGIGTTGPEAILDVRGAALAGSTNTSMMYIHSTDAQAANVGGSIGLGGRYDGTANVAQFAAIRGFKTNSTSGNASGYMSFEVRAAEAMRIIDGGNVGIGATGPSQKLEVAGTVYSTSGGFKFPDGTTQTTAASISGSGTSNYHCKFTASTTIGNSLITDDGTRITMHPSQTVWNPVLYGQSFTRNIRTLTSNGNEFGAYFEVTCAQTTSTDYTHGAICAAAYTSDPSTGSNTRDAVGADLRGEIAAGNSYGRAWGAVIYALIEDNTADGILVGTEIDVMNRASTDVASLGNNSKVGLQIVAMGTQNSTAALYITSGATEAKLWHKGLISRSNAFLPLTGTGSDANASFLELTEGTGSNYTLFRVKPSGQTVIGTQTYGSNVAQYDPTYYGALSTRETMSLFDQTTNKNIFLFSCSGAGGTNLNRIISNRYDTSVSYWPITLEVGTTEVMRLHTSGNVSVGSNTDNGYKFEVSGTVNSTSTITANLFSGNGSSLTSLNASNVSSGTLGDGRLTSNVALKNIDNAFSVQETFASGILVQKSSNDRLQVDDQDSSTQTALLLRQDGSMRRVKTIYVPANTWGSNNPPTDINVLYVN